MKRTIFIVINQRINTHMHSCMLSMYQLNKYKESAYKMLQ